MRVLGEIDKDSLVLLFVVLYYDNIFLFKYNNQQYQFQTYHI